MGGPGSGRPNPIPRGGGGRFKGSGCFIATAVYGDAEAPQVRALRTFRDNQLMPSALGRAAVAAYYRVSPPVARLLQRSPRAAAVVRSSLDQLVTRLTP